MLPCGHPAACAVQLDAQEGFGQICRWCADKAKWELETGKLIQLAVQNITYSHNEVLAQAEAERDAAVGYANRLETHYVAAYNLAQKVRRRPLILKILTFGLLKDPKVNLPDPVSLKSSS